MNFSFPYIPYRALPVVLFVIGYALLQSLAIHPLVLSPFGMLLLKSTADALIIEGIGILLTVIVPSSNYVKLDPIQRTVNLIALGLVVVLVWVVLFFFTSLVVFGEEYMERIRPLLPLSAFIGILLYMILVLYIQYRPFEADTEEEEGEANDPRNDALKKRDANEAPLPVSGSGNNNETEQLQRVAVKIGQKIHVILIPDIVYIRSDGDYVQIVTGRQQYIKEETMKYFEANLPGKQFVRVHRSYIVNVEKILRIETYEKQNQMLTLANGDKIRASAAGYKLLREALNL